MKIEGMAQDIKRLDREKLEISSRLKQEFQEYRDKMESAALAKDEEMAKLVSRAAAHVKQRDELESDLIQMQSALEAFTVPESDSH